MNYTKVEPDDQAEIIWLQLALSKLSDGRGAIVEVGKLDRMTDKALRIYQQQRNLPVTGKPDGATLQKINQELQERGLTI